MSLQRRDFGEPLDDIIVDFVSESGGAATLRLQVKQTLIISAAPSNTDFRDTIRDCWETYRQASFRMQVDRYGAAVGTVSRDRARDLRRLCEIARAARDQEDFELRFSPTGNASNPVGQIKDDIKGLIEEAAASAISGDDLRGFLAHFVLIEFDFLHEGQADLPIALNSLRKCVADRKATTASAVWDRLCGLVREGAGRSASFNRAKLVAALSASFKLTPGPSFENDVIRLGDLSRRWLRSIEDDVGGTSLDRPGLLSELDASLASNRWVQIRGLPGSGKSVLLRKRAAADLEKSTLLFLKHDRLEGSSWESFATRLGLSHVAPCDLLVEMGATGTSTLYIDGIDRVESHNQPIIADLVRAIIEDPLLADWRIVVSLRDTGIEPVRTWLGGALATTSIGTVEVTILSDQESEDLAKSKPHLRQLLFGPGAVREIVRRPFFAKVLDQNFLGGGDVSFQPGSEVDLINQWWIRGGYAAVRGSAIHRQRAILELGSRRARNLEGGIRLSDLTPTTLDVIDQLESDGIVEQTKPGHELRFSHDIFFEWSFFHVLADATEWLDEIKACGEPPALGRAVELYAQYQFANGDGWVQILQTLDASPMRSQWVREWLLAPLAIPSFEERQDQYYAAIEKDDHHLLKRALVWFQAERTTPNPLVLESDLPHDKRLQFADGMAFPAGIETWARFIGFLLAHIDRIPIRLYPDVLAVFEVWQNAFAGLKNGVSDRLLDVISEWLGDLTDEAMALRPPSEESRWDPLGSEEGSFRKSLMVLVLMASKSRPDLANAYLARVKPSNHYWRTQTSDILSFSAVLARFVPDQLLDVGGRLFRGELPDERLARERRADQRAAAERKKILAKPPEKRTRQDELALMGGHIRLGSSFGHHDWESLSINGHNDFYPASPLREPFHSLFTSAPDHALRLLSDLSNHAMKSWRQLHGLADDSRGTPLPLEVSFPWGIQRFWGGTGEFVWYRGQRGPVLLQCGYMALERWAFEQVDGGRPVDELLHQIVTGNDSMAVLGVAVSVANETQELSDAIFSLVKQQRVLDADHQRWRLDFASRSVGFRGFGRAENQPHIDAVGQANSRNFRSRELKDLIPQFYFSPTYRERIREEILAMQDSPPFLYEEERDLPDVAASLRGSARQYAELVDVANYRNVPTDTGGIALVHVSPSANTSDALKRSKDSEVKLREGAVWAWCSKYFETGQFTDGFTIESAASFAQATDHPDLFVQREEQVGDMRRGAVAAAAAVVLANPDRVSATNLEWARGALQRAAETPEPEEGLGRSPRSAIPWHPAIYVALGLAADIRNGNAAATGPHQLLGLVQHELYAVSFAALEAAFSLWEADPHLSWAALHLALLRCRYTAPSFLSIDGDQHIVDRQTLSDVMELYERKGRWWDLPLPLPLRGDRENRGAEAEDGADVVAGGATSSGGHPPQVLWNHHYAADVIDRVPVAKFMESTVRSKFTGLLAGQLAWTASAFDVPEDSEYGPDRTEVMLYEWTHSLGNALAEVAGRMPLPEFRRAFLRPLFELEDERCWEILSSFVDRYMCVFVYDPSSAASDAEELLQACLERLLEAPTFASRTWRPGEMSGFDQPRIAKSLMFVGLDQEAAGARRFANGDWTDVGLIVPIVDRFVRAAGWSSTIMWHYLEMCWRAREHYPIDTFADQVLSVLNGERALQGWRNSVLPARIAGLVQHFVERESVSLELGKKLLRILDALIDMGDRRSAALQNSASFRKIRLAS